jgi:hypothetical protein
LDAVEDEGDERNGEGESSRKINLLEDAEDNN